MPGRGGGVNDIPRPITRSEYDAARRRLNLTKAFRVMTRPEQAVAVAVAAVEARDLPRPTNPHPSIHCCPRGQRMAEDFGLGSVAVARLREEHPHTPEAIEAAHLRRVSRTP